MIRPRATRSNPDRLHLLWLSLFSLGLTICLSGTTLSAQDTSTQLEATPTLHVSTNLIQIPVLVLTPAREKLPAPIAANRFSISFDDGPWFRPKYARLQGDDPIDLAIVLDARTPQADLLPKMAPTIADLAPSFLHPHDRVSIYVIDCSVLHSTESVPAEPMLLKDAVNGALNSWTERWHEKKRSACSLDAHLWDVLTYVTHTLSGQPGRRVVLAVTNGDDGKSKHSSADLTAMAQIGGVTIFGLNPARDFFQGPRLKGVGEDLLSTVCELSGGMLLDLNGSSLAKKMQRFTEILRERYILEFPRPAHAIAGNLRISVRIDKTIAFIRPAGDGVPLANPSLVADANTIHIDPPSPPQSEDQPTVKIPPAQQQPASAPVATQQPPAVAPLPASAPVAEQQPETSPDMTVPTLKVSTRLTVEDVTVTDTKRSPVHGLLQSDFTIKEDGKPQLIRNFEEFGTQRPSPQPAPPQLPRNVYTNQQPPPPTTSAVNVILLDDVSTGLMNGLAMAPENLSYATQQSIKYLKKMPVGTQVAILQLSSNLSVLQGFTSDKAVLLATMHSASYRPVAGAYVVPPRSSVTACAAANVQSQLTVNALIQTAAFLSGIKGRKNLIWFTPGTPWLTNYRAFSAVPCLNDYTPQLHKAYGLLTAAEVALYPVDPRGLFSDPALSAGSALKIGQGSQTREAAAFGSNTTEEHDSLQDMARATGGVPFFNRNDLDAAVEEAIATGADYYSLSYVPPLSKYDGKYHTIDVKVGRPSLHLQYREGYTSVDPAKLSESTEKSSSKTAATPESEFHAAMGHGEAGSTQLLFDVRVTPSTASTKPESPSVIGSLNPMLKDKHLVRYDLLYTLSADQITLEEGPDGTRKGSIEFVMAAYDAEGRMLNVLSQTATMALKPNEVSRFMQQPFQVPLQFDLPVGNIFVRVGVMDVPSKKMGTLEITEAVLSVQNRSQTR
jgi:VWFA-related protein